MQETSIALFPDLKQGVKIRASLSPSSLIFMTGSHISKSQWSWRNFQNPGLSTGYKSPIFDLTIELAQAKSSSSLMSKNRIKPFHKAKSWKKFSKVNRTYKTTKKVTQAILTIWTSKKVHILFDFSVRKRSQVKTSFTLANQKLFPSPILWARPTPFLATKTPLNWAFLAREKSPQLKLTSLAWIARDRGYKIFKRNWVGYTRHLEVSVVPLTECLATQRNIWEFPIIFKPRKAKSEKSQF